MQKQVLKGSAQIEFLETLEKGLTVVDAVRAAKISVSTAYRWRRLDEKFAEDWDFAYAMGSEPLEKEAHRRAFEGCQRTERIQGSFDTKVTTYSDELVMFLLKARNPLKYCERARLELLKRQMRGSRIAKLGPQYRE